MAAESYVAETWLYNKLTADTTLKNQVGSRVYSYVAPQGAAFPFIVYSLYSCSDVMEAGSNRIFSAMTYLVKAIGDQSVSGTTLKTIVDAIDSTLHRATGTSGSATILSCVRDSQVSYAEVSQGITYRHVGGLYRIVA